MNEPENKIGDEPKNLCVCGNPLPCEYEARVDAYMTSKSGIQLDWSKLPKDTFELREILGKQVRIAWIEWANTQENPKPSWLVPYEELVECDKEADRVIGERIWNIAKGIIHKDSLTPRPEDEDALVRQRVGTAISNWLNSDAGKEAFDFESQPRKEGAAAIDDHGFIMNPLTIAADSPDASTASGESGVVRYDIACNIENKYCEMEVCQDGIFVLHSDYKKLEKQTKELADQDWETIDGLQRRLYEVETHRNDLLAAAKDVIEFFNIKGCCEPGSIFYVLETAITVAEKGN